MFDRVSIITPSLNSARFIEETLISVRDQTYQDIEHIVIDGGSTDGTVDILKKYEGGYDLKWIGEPDRGQSDAFNKGIKLSTGQWLLFVNSNDYVLKSHFRKSVGYEQKSYSLFYRPPLSFKKVEELQKFCKRLSVICNKGCQERAKPN